MAFSPVTYLQALFFDTYLTLSRATSVEISSDIDAPLFLDFSNQWPCFMDIAEIILHCSHPSRLSSSLSLVIYDCPLFGIIKGVEHVFALRKQNGNINKNCMVDWPASGEVASLNRNHFPFSPSLACCITKINGIFVWMPSLPPFL